MSENMQEINGFSLSKHRFVVSWAAVDAWHDLCRNEPEPPGKPSSEGTQQF